MPSLKITASAMARRAARGACWATTACAACAVQPGRDATRRTWVASSQSTTSTHWTRARQWRDSVSKGTSKTTGLPAASPDWRCASRPING
jgi:hypothetical protein